MGWLGAFLWGARAQAKLFRMDQGQLPECIMCHARTGPEPLLYTVQCLFDLSVHTHTHTLRTAKTRAKAQEKRLKKTPQELQGSPRRPTHTHTHTHKWQKAHR